MNTLTYELDSTTLAAGAAGVDVFESGSTLLHISLTGTNDPSTNYHYLKFIVKYSDLDQHYTLQSTSNLLSGAGLSISRIFHPSFEFHTTYTIDISGLRTDQLVDLYRINFTVSKPPLNFYKDQRLVNAYLHSNQYGKNSLLVTTEAEDPNYVSNFLIPYNKNLVNLGGNPYIPKPLPAFSPGDDNILRSEMFTFNTIGSVAGGGNIPIITEKDENSNSANPLLEAGGSDAIIEERQFVQYVIAAQEEIGQHDVNGYGTGLLSMSGTQTDLREVDINDDVHDAQLIIVPEDGINYSENMNQTESYRSYVQNNNTPNAFVKLIFAYGDIEHPESKLFKEVF